MAWLLSPFMVSCGPDVVYDLPDGDKFDNLYLVQAVNPPRTTKIFMLEDQVQTANYSAFYSGLKAPKDIHITFEVDPELVDAYNQANQTNFKMMPEGSFEIEATEAVIPAGQSRTNLMKVSLNTFGYMEAFEEYLLPLAMKTDDVKMNESLSVIYYQVSASYEPGNVPCREVGSGIADAVEIFSYNDKCLLARSADGKLRRYGYNASENTFSAGTVMKTDWTNGPHGALFCISAGRENTLQVVYGSLFQWWALSLNEDGTVIPDLNATTDRTLVTGGCGIFDQSIWSVHPTGYVVRTGYNSILYYPMASNWKAPSGAGVWTEFNFKTYSKMMIYGYDFIGIDDSGNMWHHKFSTATSTFANPTKLGSGWEDYTHVIPFGNSLLARDADGVLWEYEFDIRGFWALK